MNAKTRITKREMGAPQTVNLSLDGPVHKTCPQYATQFVGMESELVKRNVIWGFKRLLNNAHLNAKTTHSLLRKCK